MIEAGGTSSHCSHVETETFSFNKGAFPPQKLLGNFTGWTSQERPFTGTFTGSNWVLAPRQAPLSFIEFAAVYTKTQSGISFVFYKCHNTTCAVYLVFLNTLMCRQTQLAAVEPKNATWAKLHNCTLRVVEHCLSPPMSPPASFFSLRIYCSYSSPGKCR